MNSWERIERQLTERKRDITREIRSFPAPIPACDVYYNSLLVERRKLSEALQRLEKLKLDGNASVESFISQYPLIDENS